MGNQQVYNYVYASYDKDNNFYIGSHSTNNLKDNYLGSYTRKDFHPINKQILTFCDSFEECLIIENYLLESIVWNKDPKCMNKAIFPLYRCQKPYVNPSKDPAIRKKQSDMAKTPERLANSFKQLEILNNLQKGINHPRADKTLYAIINCYNNNILIDNKFKLSQITNEKIIKDSERYGENHINTIGDNAKKNWVIYACSINPLHKNRYQHVFEPIDVELDGKIQTFYNTVSLCSTLKIALCGLINIIKSKSGISNRHKLIILRDYSERKYLYQLINKRKHHT